MAGFSADWLAVREPADHAARSTTVTGAAAEALARVSEPGILDLACGTGSNLRYLRNAGSERTWPTFSGRWLLVDHDAGLLARVPRSADVETRCLDLSTLDDPSIFAGRALVTASALLDLVSDRWLRVLADRCAAAGAAALFALNYDGRIECSPGDPDDAAIAALVNQHQKTDKGFGLALGPDSTDRAEHWFKTHGYQTARERSDWVLIAASGDLQRQLITGWAHAAAEIAPAQRRVIAAWHDRRLAHVVAGRSELIVGHEDIAAIRSRA